MLPESEQNAPDIDWIHIRYDIEYNQVDIKDQDMIQG